jgi:hypothetical protein
MEKVLIEDYRIGWSLDQDHDQNKGRVEIKKEGADDFVKVPINSINEFMALSTLLNGKKHVFVNDETWFFGTVDFDN